MPGPDLAVHDLVTRTCFIRLFIWQRMPYLSRNLEAFLESCPSEKRAADAVMTYLKPLDHSILARWISWFSANDTTRLSGQDVGADRLGA
jgi:hypothetical protein